MSYEPLVTVIIPVYNAGIYLRSAVESIINQTYKKLEILIVDDGSTDNCLETLKDINDSRIRVISQSNCGKATAVNNALDVMQGEFFTLQDADDYSYPKRIESQLNAILFSSSLVAVFIGHDILLKDKIFAPTFKSMDVDQCSLEIDHFRMPGHDALGLYRKSIVDKMRYDPELTIEEGVDFVLRVGEQFPIILLGKCLYTYRINYDSTIRKDPLRTLHYVNLVRKRACERRGVPFRKKQMAKVKKTSFFFRHRNFDTHIIPHSMDSVLQCKYAGKIKEAYITSYQCISLHPFDPIYYKPFIYTLLPGFIVKKYRNIKAIWSA